MSTMSDMTTVTVNGQRVKKKRSAFGWLRKAFALSDEEKAEFERKKMLQRAGVGDGYRDGYFERRGEGERRWVDGRRVR